eukprot:scaffold122099_cov35-Tisochrysis_lutea.AAC.2
MHSLAYTSVARGRTLVGIAVFAPCEPAPADRISVSPREFLGYIRPEPPHSKLSWPSGEQRNASKPNGPSMGE